MWRSAPATNLDELEELEQLELEIPAADADGGEKLIPEVGDALCFYGI